MIVPGGRWRPVLLGALLTGLTFGLHVLPGMNSMLNLDAPDHPAMPGLFNTDFLRYTVEVHGTEPAFARRPFTTWIIDAAARIGGLDIAHAFVITEFMLLFVSGLLLYRLARILGTPQGAALLTMVAYHLSFSVLSAWFPPIYTYDEPLQYCLLFTALSALVQRRWWVFALLFAAASCVRESSLLLLPSLFLFLSDGAWRPRSWATGSNVTRALAFGLPAVVAVLFAWWYTRHIGAEAAMAGDLAGRDSFFEHNTADAAMTWETLIYLYMAIGLPAFVLFATGTSGTTSDPHRTSFRHAFIVAVVINTLVVILSTKAREARLFALPLVFAWPLLGRHLQEHWKDLIDPRALRTALRRWPYSLALLFGAGLLVLIVDHGWELSDGNASGNLWHEYFLLQSLVILTSVLVRRASARA